VRIHFALSGLWAVLVRLKRVSGRRNQPPIAS
jgi:hypothetical protein